MMRKHYPVILLLAALTGFACAPRELKPVADIDHSPLLEVIGERRNILGAGLSGTLEMDFKREKERYRGKAYVLAFPDGPFRLEIPGPWGSTHLVMASDGREILAYYPGEDKAYRSLAEGRSLDPYLPFPLPVKPEMAAALFMGVFPLSGEVSKASANLMDSGEKRLLARWEGSGLTFSYLFHGGPEPALERVTATDGDMKLEVNTGKTAPYLPREFNLTFPGVSLRGKWSQVALFEGSAGALELKIPAHIEITDLEGMK